MQGRPVLLCCAARPTKPSAHAAHTCCGRSLSSASALWQWGCHQLLLGASHAASCMVSPLPVAAAVNCNVDVLFICKETQYLFICLFIFWRKPYRSSREQNRVTFPGVQCSEACCILHGSSFSASKGTRVSYIFLLFKIVFWVKAAFQNLQLVDLPADSF